MLTSSETLGASPMGQFGGLSYLTELENSSLLSLPLFMIVLFLLTRPFGQFFSISFSVSFPSVYPVNIFCSRVLSWINTIFFLLTHGFKFCFYTNYPKPWFPVQIFMLNFGLYIQLPPRQHVWMFCGHLSWACPKLNLEDLPFRSSPDHEFSTLVVGIGTNPVSHVISKQDLPNRGPSGEDYSLHWQGSILWPFPLATDDWIWVDASPNLDQSGYLLGLSSAIIDAWTRAVAAMCMEKSRKLVNRERL